MRAAESLVGQEQDHPPEEEDHLREEATEEATEEEQDPPQAAQEETEAEEVPHLPAADLRPAATTTKTTIPIVARAHHSRQNGEEDAPSRPPNDQCCLRDPKYRSRHARAPFPGLHPP